MHKIPIFLFILFALAFHPLSAADSPSALPSPKKTICLNMIVKDESKVIERCLASVKPLIDYWVIVDTGSSDGTQTVIREFLKDTPGELYERPWVNFEHNRNEAMHLAEGKGDYLLFIDADEQYKYSDNFSLPVLDKDYYYITVQQISSNFQRIALINNHLKWYWKGVMHETLDSNQAETFDVLKNVINLANTSDGHRSQNPNKYLDDAKVLEIALKDEPDNARYVFFLAQSYLSAKEYELAYKNYEKRSLMGGWDQEVFFSLYRMGMLNEFLEKPAEKIINSYCTAFQARPTRAEPLYRLANFFNRNGNYILGYLTAKHGISIPNPHDTVHTENWMYDYGMWQTYGNSAFLVGKYEEAAQIYQQLLASAELPENEIKATRHNLECAQNKCSNRSK